MFSISMVHFIEKFQFVFTTKWVICAVENSHDSCCSNDKVEIKKTTSENILVNHCKYIDIQKIDALYLNQQFTIILANINRNIILDNLAELVKATVSGGQVLLSGLLVTDEAEIREACGALGLIHRKTVERNGWIAIWFSR